MKNMFILHARRVRVQILVPSWTNPNQHVFVVPRYHASSFRHDQSRWRPCDELKWISNGGKKWFCCNPRICLEYLRMYLCWLLPSEFPHDFLSKLYTLETSKLLHYRSPSKSLCGDMYMGDMLPPYCRYRSQDLTTNMRGKFDFFYSPWDHKDGTETGRLWCWRKAEGMPHAVFHSINLHVPLLRVIAIKRDHIFFPIHHGFLIFLDSSDPKVDFFRNAESNYWIIGKDLRALRSKIRLIAAQCTLLLAENLATSAKGRWYLSRNLNCQTNIFQTVKYLTANHQTLLTDSNWQIVWPTFWFFRHLTATVWPTKAITVFHSK